MHTSEIVFRIISENGGDNANKAVKLVKESFNFLPQSWQKIVPKFDVVVADTTFNLFEECNSLVLDYIKGRSLCLSNKKIDFDLLPIMAWRNRGPIYVRYDDNMNPVFFRRRFLKILASILYYRDDLFSHLVDKIFGQDQRDIFIKYFADYIIGLSSVISPLAQSCPKIHSRFVELNSHIRTLHIR